MSDLKGGVDISGNSSAPVFTLRGITPNKLDNYPVLIGSENYQGWAGTWEIGFDMMGIKEVLTGEIIQPEKNSPE